MNKQNKGEGKRGIEWTDYTWNPIGGCQHGCAWKMPDGSTANCYAEDVAEGIAKPAYPHGFEHHYWNPDQLTAPSSVKKPSRIFVGSMADVFGAWVPREQIQTVIDVCTQNPQHTFQFLTKNAPRLKQFDFPANCWLGVSVPPSVFRGRTLTHHQQTEMLMATWHQLQLVGGKGGALTWMSIEPLSWDISPFLRYAPIRWAVIGAASRGSTIYQPDPEWVKNAVAVLDEMNTPIFFKGNLKGNTAASPWREDFPVSRTEQATLFN